MKSNTRLRQESVKKVLTEIREKGPISKRELQEITGFSWGNISSVTTLLINDGYVEALGKQKTSVGRKPEEVDINTKNNFIIGVDFNSRGILVAVCDLKGRVKDKYTVQCKNADKDEVIKLLYGVISKAIENNKTKNISHIALAMQGEVDTENGISVKNSMISNWENVPICKLLYERFNIKTVLFHDPDCLLYAEKYFGQLDSNTDKNAFLIRIDHGVGVAVSLEGRMYMGNKDKTCEIGPQIVPYKNSQTSLGKIINDSGIEKEYLKVSNNKKSFLEIVSLAKQCDKEALTVIENVAKSFAVALNNTACLFNPEKILVFSSNKDYCELLLQYTKETLSELMPLCPVPIISELGIEAAAVGAALFAADSAIEELNFT